jgi:hypothetical protein
MEYSSLDQVWSDTCMDHLVSAFAQLENTAETKSGLSIRWTPPPALTGALLLAETLVNHEFDQEMLRNNPCARALLEQAIGHLAHWLSDLVRESPFEAEEDQSMLHQGLAARWGAMLYTRFRSYELRRTEGPLLQILLSNRVRSAIVLGVDLLVDQPPNQWQDASLAISSLVQSNHWQPSDVFPRLLDATHPAVLSPALDLANLAYEERGIRPHPAADRIDSLLSMLGAVVSQLDLLEENPSRFSGSVSEIQRMLFDSVSLTVSLCHTMSLLDDRRAIGKLNQAMGLGHRRIRAEAAFALARLQDPRAVEVLLGLADDDVARPRVLQYLDELGLKHRIRPEWDTELAHARAKLALRLSQPENFAFPPHRMEVFDERRMTVPGHVEPQNCFLLRYFYELGNRTHSNIGFSGPFVHLFPSDISDWEPDAIYEIVMQSIEQ